MATSQPSNRSFAAVPDRPQTGLLILAVGVATILTPYWWSELYRFSGFTFALTPYYLWQLLPFAVLAAAVSGPRALPGWAAGLLLLVLVAVCTGVIRDVSADPNADSSAIARLPWLLTPLVVGGWALGRHRVLRGTGAASGPTVPLMLAWLLAAVGVLAAGRALPLDEWASGQTFALLFASIVVEALPFILLGASVSAGLEVFVSDGLFAKAANLPLRLQLPVAVGGALAFPVCECGSVPVARRLILKGMHPSAGLAFMLAAPIVNPVVMFSTYVAYQGRGGLSIVLARALLGLGVALVAGLLIGSRRAEGMLRTRPDAAHDHHHHDGRLRAFTDHVSADFLFMGKFVVAGAALAAAAQTVVPQSVFAGVLASPLVGALVLMGAAFVLSLCSEADAFVAVSFIQFPPGPQLAFLAFGPILDIKLALLYSATFGRAFVLRLAVIAIPTVLLGSLLAGALL